MAAIRRAGIDRLYKQGFAGMTLRELAADVGIQAGSLYNHFSNKQELLYSILIFVMTELLDELKLSLQSAKDPHSALMAFVECHVIFHCDKRKEVLVSTTELRSLTPENYRRTIEFRDQYEKQLKDILIWGAQENYWQAVDYKIATKLILGMMTSVGVWYRTDGPVDKTGIVKIYQATVDNLLKNEMQSLRMHAL
nr:TetR/AcrR family transcriptional regulator [Sneathiella limimaris]